MTRLIRGLVFDFDGLILETEGPDYQSWRELYEGYGCNLPLDRWVALIGTGTSGDFSPYDELDAQLGRLLDRTEIRTKRRARYAELVAAEMVMPGVLEYIADARRLGFLLGIASSSTREWVVGHLQRLGLYEHFATVACGDEVAHTKPDPAAYNLVLDNLGLQSEEAIALEDSPNGIAAAKAAGLFCVAVPNDLTRDLPLSAADLRLESLADLPLEQLISYVQHHGTLVYSNRSNVAGLHSRCALKPAEAKQGIELRSLDEASKGLAREPT